MNAMRSSAAGLSARIARAHLGVAHRARPSRRAAASSSGCVARPAVQRVEGLESEQQAERAARDLRADRHALVVRLAREVEHLLPLVGVEVVLEQRERDRAPGLAREPAHPVHLLLGRGEVLAHHARRRELEHARAGVGERAAHREQLVLGRVRAGDRLAVDRAVGDRARRRHAERAGLDALADDARHRLDVVGRRRLVARAALAHHVAAHRAVRHLRADVDRELLACRGRRGTRGTSPSPTGCPPTARRRGCPRRPPSGR